MRPACAALFALLCCGCATLEQDLWQARGAWTEAEKAYNRALEIDNARVVACYAAHPDLRGDAAREACPPRYDEEKRALALALSEAALGDFERANVLIGANHDERAAELIGVLEARVLQFLILYGGDQ